MQSSVQVLTIHFKVTSAFRSDWIQFYCELQRRFMNSLLHRYQFSYHIATIWSEPDSADVVELETGLIFRYCFAFNRHAGASSELCTRERKHKPARRRVPSKNAKS